MEALQCFGSRASISFERFPVSSAANLDQHTPHFSGNLFAIMFVLVDGALRAPPTASPPLNMHKALIFNGTFIMVMCISVFFVRGTQVRRENDVRIGQEMLE